MSFGCPNNQSSLELSAKFFRYFLNRQYFIFVYLSKTQSGIGEMETIFLLTVYTRGGQPFEARVQQKEKSKLRGPHPGSDKRRATEASDWPLLISAAYQYPRMSYRPRELIDCYYVSFNTPT